MKQANKLLYGCHGDQSDCILILLQRSILYDLKDEIVPPTNETVAQVFARLSAYRDAMDGPQVTFILCAWNWLFILSSDHLLIPRLHDEISIQLKMREGFSGEKERPFSLLHLASHFSYSNGHSLCCHNYRKIKCMVCLQSQSRTKEICVVHEFVQHQTCLTLAADR